MFRAPPLVMFGAAFGLTALAAHAVHDLDGPRVARAGRRLLGAGLGVAGVLALVALGAGATLNAWNDVFRPDLDSALRAAQLGNLGAFRGGAWAAAFVLALGALIADAMQRGRAGRRAAVAGLIVLAVIDAWRIDRQFVAVVDPRPFVQPPPLLAQLQQEGRSEKFRVMPIAAGLQANEMGYFGIESILGFHDNELSWYRALRAEPAAQDLLAANATGYPLLRVLNVKYILHDRPDAPNPYPVPDYLPRFRVVDDWEVARGPAAVTARLLDEGFDPERIVLLEEDPGIPRRDAAAVTEAGRVMGYDYRGNEIRIQVEASAPCFLVHAENWFPYWHAFVGGTEVPILRAYGTIRAIPLPAGHSDVVLRFRSAPFEWGRGLSSAAIVGLMIAWGVSFARRRLRGGGAP
jgi:hypothetical protein